jgi:hypothetical protein
MEVMSIIYHEGSESFGQMPGICSIKSPFLPSFFEQIGPLVSSSKYTLILPLFQLTVAKEEYMKEREATANRTGTGRTKKADALAATSVIRWD